jgi:hypothetical protein
MRNEIFRAPRVAGIVLETTIQSGHVRFGPALIEKSAFCLQHQLHRSAIVAIGRTSACCLNRGELAGSTILVTRRWSNAFSCHQKRLAYQSPYCNHPGTYRSDKPCPVDPHFSRGLKVDSHPTRSEPMLSRNHGRNHQPPGQRDLRPRDPSLRLHATCRPDSSVLHRLPVAPR